MEGILLVTTPHRGLKVTARIKIAQRRALRGICLVQIMPLRSRHQAECPHWRRQYSMSLKSVRRSGLVVVIAKLAADDARRCFFLWPLVVLKILTEIVAQKLFITNVDEG